MDAYGRGARFHLFPLFGFGGGLADAEKKVGALIRYPNEKVLRRPPPQGSRYPLLNKGGHSPKRKRCYSGDPLVGIPFTRKIFQLYSS